MTRRAESLLLAGIVVTGIATVILGAALPMLQLRYGVSEAELGRLFAAQFAGGAVAATLSLRRPRFSIIGGFQFIAVGIAAAGFASWRFASLAVLFYGIGLGLVLPSANMAVALARENSRGASLSVLNLAWGLGAAATPILLLSARGGHLLSSIYLLVAVLAEMIGIILWFTFPPFPQARVTNGLTGESFDSRILVHGVGFLLYIGAEGCVGGWTSEYVFRTFASPHFATSAIAGFWIGLLAGRGAAPSILSRISEARLLRASLALALSGVFVMLAAPVAYVVTLGTLMVGLGMASIYGLQVSNATGYAQRKGTKIPGWLFTCGSIGGATLPWLFGVVAEQTSLRFALLLPIVALVLLVALSAQTNSRASTAS
jgi:MFS transporter, FHS family, glucose/mannose:H+ symporter